MRRLSDLLFQLFTVLLFTGLAAAASPAPPPDPEKNGYKMIHETSVSASKGWQKTGIFLKAGQQFIITASGSWGKGFAIKTGPEGYVIGGVSTYDSDFDNMSLIGRIDAGKPFFIGPGVSQKTEAAGELELRPNISDVWMWNNSGAVIARIYFHQDNIVPKSVAAKKRTVAAKQRSDVDDIALSKPAEKKNSYAVVIGIEQYRQEIPKADFAANDAQVVSEYLTKMLGYPESNVVTLINDRATKSDFEKYFERWLVNNVDADSSVFVYYSGHGSPNPTTGDAYIVPFDGDPLFIDMTGYSLKRLYENLGRLKAREINVVIDSCFSGTGGRSVIAKGTRPLVVQTREPVRLAHDKLTVLTASSGAQTTMSYEEKGHGLFTYFLLKSLKEGGIAQNGGIDFQKLYTAIKPQVEAVARKLYNNEQSPQLISSDSK